MKYIYIVILFFLFSRTAFGQLADITYSVKTINITSYESDCWESGDEEYT